MRNSVGIGENSIQYSPVGHGGTQAVTPRQGAVPNVTRETCVLIQYYPKNMFLFM